jgi:hypothetical protein
MINTIHGQQQSRPNKTLCYNDYIVALMECKLFFSIMFPCESHFGLPILCQQICIHKTRYDHYI